MNGLLHKSGLSTSGIVAQIRWFRNGHLVALASHQVIERRLKNLYDTGLEFCNFDGLKAGKSTCGCNFGFWCSRELFPAI